PCALVVVRVSIPVCVLRNSREASGTTAPVESVTVPLIEAVETCAGTTPAENKRAATTNTAQTALEITSRFAEVIEVSSLRLYEPCHDVWRMEDYTHFHCRWPFLKTEVAGCYRLRWETAASPNGYRNLAYASWLVRSFLYRCVFAEAKEKPA